MVEFSGQQIYRIFTQAEGTQAWQAARAAARALADDLADQSAGMTRLLTGLESTWSGAASEAATGSGRRLATEVETAADAVRVTDDVLDRQVDSWHTAQHSVVPVPDLPAPVNPVQGLADGGPAHQQRWQRVLDAAGTNVRVYENYQAASAEHRAQLPDDYGDLLNGPGTAGAPARPGSAGGAPPGSWAPDPNAEADPADDLFDGSHGTTSPTGSPTSTGRHSQPARRVAGRRSGAVPAMPLHRGSTARRATGLRPARPPVQPPSSAGPPEPFTDDDGTTPPVIGA